MTFTSLNRNAVTVLFWKIHGAFLLETQVTSFFSFFILFLFIYYFTKFQICLMWCLLEAVSCHHNTDITNCEVVFIVNMNIQLELCAI